MKFSPLAQNFAAEVVDFDPRGIHDPAVRAELNAAFDRYRLLVFPNLDFDARAQSEFGEVFGEHVKGQPVPEQFQSGEENTLYVSNSRPDGILPNGELLYHQDHLFDPEPVRALMLYAVEAPSAGGATKFRSADDTYRRLDEATRALADSVRCFHLFDYAGPIPGENIEKRVCYSLDSAAPGSPRTWQPLVWRDPRDGVAAVWASYGSTVAFDGVDSERGYQLLSDILDCAAEGEEYVHQWRVGDALIWNNLHLQHARTPFDPTERRTLRRTTLM